MQVNFTRHGCEHPIIQQKDIIEKGREKTEIIEKSTKVFWTLREEFSVTELLIEQNPIWSWNKLNRVFPTNQDLRFEIVLILQPESDCIRLKNTMEQIQQLENTIGGNGKLLSDPELGKMAVHYKKESMEIVELLVSKLRALPPCVEPDCLDHTPLTKLKNKSNNKHKFKNRKAKNESSDDFVFPYKTARPSSPTKTEEQIKTQNNLENLT
ncbi:hypothetical protein TNIN_265611 [Trichonephila inaurata madagascariensis]|uniref:Uncharacterized protein n=1 Tax=Trichonephila inaurata madagascariensis TaxID=2747483 RepID=A0A8X7CKK1_9ARAC|nr:hypothetical protein TNIN_260761 [Trichonephila inaurata madagascariensis]GFY75919.1 hypothetical protein TNIN_265611 [Trichonephila inaurata madagascariensis]